MDIKTKIGLRIKELRTQKEVTQEGLAWNAEIKRTFMNYVENSKRKVSDDVMEIVRTLNIQNYFLEKYERKYKRNPKFIF
jgi:DNA-binding XRE family transcriptional regulator